MANENRQVVRLAYPDKEAFQADSAGRERLSAFILEEDGKNSIGIRTGDTCRYINDNTDEVVALKAMVQFQSSQIATLAGQIGATLGTTHFGAVRPSMSGPVTFPYNSGDSEFFNPFTYATFDMPSGDANYPAFGGNILIASPYVHSELWVRAFSGSPITYKLYGAGGSTLLAECTATDSNGYFPFVDVSNPQKVWGYFHALYSVPAFSGSSTAHLLASPQKGFAFTLEQVSVPGARIRVPFNFVLEVGSSGASEIVFKAYVCTLSSWAEDPSWYPVLAQPFEIAGYGSGRVHFTGELVAESITWNGDSPYQNFRSWIELRGPDPATSPLTLSLGEPQTGGYVVPGENYSIVLGYSCLNPGGSDLGAMELHSVSAFFEPPPANLTAFSPEEEPE